MTNSELESKINFSNIEKGNEKEEYITRLPREKYPWLEGVLMVDLWKVAFEPNC